MLLYYTRHPYSLLLFFLLSSRPPRPTLFPYTTLFRSQAGDRLEQLLHRPRLPVDGERRPLTGRDQDPLGLPAADQRVAHVDRVDQAVAGVEQVEDARVARPHRIGDEVRRGRLEAVARDAGEDERVDLERVQPRALEGLPARRRGELARLHLR